MKTPMNKRTIATLGGTLCVSGLALILFLAMQQRQPVIFGLTILGLGFIWIGNWLVTVAKSMNKSTGDESEKDFPDR